MLSSRKAFLIFLWAAVFTVSFSSEVAENLTEADDAEFRQGGIAQQLMPNYGGMSVGGLYGGSGANAYQMMGGANSASNGGYVNMIRNLYRPPSFGLTDKVRHWVKSFMNRRQYVKPYYNPSIGGMSYATGDVGTKPMFANGYKAISVPLRQLQKYYKPYYASSEGGNNQYLQSSGANGPASGSSLVSYNAAGSPSANGLYASESASSGHFAGANGGLYGSSSDSSALFGAGGSSSGGFFSNNQPSGLFSSSGSNSGGFYSPSASALGSEGSSSSGLFGSQGLYGSSGSPGSGLFHGGSSNFPVEASYGSDSSNPFFGTAGSSGGYGTASNSFLSQLNGAGGNAGSYGDLFASGANPASSVYSPSGDNSRGYGGQMKKSPYGSASNSALYVSSNDNQDSYSSKSSKELTNSFNVDTSRHSPSEASYSVSFQPAQSKSFSSSLDNANFQPVAMQEKSSS